jgi:hypothetical protein
MTLPTASNAHRLHSCWKLPSIRIFWGATCDTHLPLKLVIELLESLLAQQFLTQRNFSSMLSMLQALPATFQVMYQLSILRCKRWLIQRLELGVNVEVECLNLTALLIPTRQEPASQTLIHLMLQTILILYSNVYHCNLSSHFHTGCGTTSIIYLNLSPAKTTDNTCSLCYFLQHLAVFRCSSFQQM